MKTLSAALALSLSLLGFTAQAEPAQAPIPCRCESDPLTAPLHHATSGTDLRAFREGTPNVHSPHAMDPDTLYLMYSHNFFWSSLPRSSNPAFWAHYSPFERFQADMMTTLRSPVEVEFGLSYQILDELQGDWLSLTPRLAYNTRGNLFGGEISATRFLIPDVWQIGLDARVLSTAQPDGFNRPVAALGANTLLRVWKDWHLYGDVAVPLDGEILQQRSVVWSAGVKKRIPHTPHILTLYAGNSQEQSLSGRTISGGNSLADFFRVGFVFSIAIPELTRLPERLF